MRMSCISLVAVWCCLPSVIVSLRAENASNTVAMPAHLKGGYFARVTVTATNLTIQMKSSGQRYLYRKDAGTLTKLAYGAKISVAVGGSLVISGRGDNISFSPLPEAIKSKGFQITDVVDLRSVGRGRQISKVYMITSGVAGEQELKENVVALLEASPATVKRLTGDKAEGKSAAK